MLIYPAIDLRGGRCVRLRQGDYSRETVFDDDPAAVGRRWASVGASFLHLVDLDGAKAGHPVNGYVVRRIRESAGIPCQLGGGIRSEAHIDDVLSWGVERVILGTRALQDPDWCESMARRHPGRVALGLDARQGRVATEGWLTQSETTALDVALHCANWPLAAVIYTDIARDGMMQGPNVEATAELSEALRRAASTPVGVIASGGVTTIADVAELARAGLAGCIIGRAIYEGTIDLAEAIAVARKEAAAR